MYDPNMPQQPAASPRKPVYKRKGFWIGVAALTVVGAIANGAKEAPSADTEAKPTVTVAPSPTSADDALKQVQKHNKKGRADLQKQIDEASESAAAVETGDLPSFVGMDLQDAQDAAQAAGFYNLRDKDASGQGRFQILDHDWKVCSQEPAAGSHGLEITVTMYAVKKFESC
jgi:hypothetical protein